MIISKPSFWSKKIGIISIVLFPISFLFLLIIFLKKRFIKVKKFKIKIICVGNIYVGGTGKTPLSIFLGNELKKLGKNPIILRKYYKNHNDEYNLITSNFKNLILTKNRSASLRELEKSDFNIAILDDGLQDYGINKDLSIACFNYNQLVGNGLIMPSGPLRENLSALKNTNIVIINGGKNQEFEEKILTINPRLEIFYSSYKPIDMEKFKNKNLLAIAGIGNPENFFQLMEENNLTIKKKMIFPDHYIFAKNEIQIIVDKAKKENLQIVMTEKDYFKINKFNINSIECLKVSLEIENHQELLEKIVGLYDKNN